MLRIIFYGFATYRRRVVMTLTGGATFNEPVRVLMKAFGFKTVRKQHGKKADHYECPVKGLNLVALKASFELAGLDVKPLPTMPPQFDLYKMGENAAQNIVQANAKTKAVKADGAVFYHYTQKKPQVVSLRGKGLKTGNVKAIVAGKGLRWVFRKGRRMVAAYQAEMTPHKLIEVLLAIKAEGVEVYPAKNLASKHWLYLDTPKVVVSLELRTMQEFGHEKLVEWLEANGYSRITNLEQPGDFEVRGESIFVWTRESDHLYRIVFDGDIVEQIGRINPETTEVEIVATANLGNVPTREVKVEVEKVEQAAEVTVDVSGVMPTFSATPMPAAPAPKGKIIRKTDSPTSGKYSSGHVSQLVKSFTKLDKSHPLHGLVKWS